MQASKIVTNDTPHDELMFMAYGEDAGLSRAQHEKVYSFAYAQGHSAGESEVEHYYISAVEFAQDLLAASPDLR